MVSLNHIYYLAAVSCFKDLRVFIAVIELDACLFYNFLFEWFDLMFKLLYYLSMLQFFIVYFSFPIGLFFFHFKSHLVDLLSESFNFSVFFSYFVFIIVFEIFILYHLFFFKVFNLSKIFFILFYSCLFQCYLMFSCYCLNLSLQSMVISF